MEAVIVPFRDRGAEDVFDGRASKAAHKACPRPLWPVARRKLDQVNRVSRLLDLAVPPGNQLESLKRDRVGQHSIRINDQYRICFRWEAGDAYEVEITNYH